MTVALTGGRVMFQRAVPVLTLAFSLVWCLAVAPSYPLPDVTTDSQSKPFGTGQPAMEKSADAQEPVASRDTGSDSHAKTSAEIDKLKTETAKLSAELTNLQLTNEALG